VPRFEALEDRTVPSTLTVQNNFDSGAGSLRDTIAAASSGDTIDFAKDLKHATITLTSGELLIAKSLDIEGLGAKKLAISGNNAGRIFDIAAGASVTIAGLTITDGLAAAGGAIDNAGTLTIRDAALPGNRAVGGMGGGAIANEHGASLTLSDSLLADNTATAGAASDVFGGALLNLGSAVVLACKFTENQALGGAAPVGFTGSQGGAIDNFGGATLTVTASTFVNNAAIGAAGLFFGVGGAIENNAGPDYGFGGTPGSTAHIADCTFTGNLATGGNTADGGALDNEGLGTTMSIIGSTLDGNRAIGGDGGDGITALSQGTGGGVMNLFGTMTISDSTIEDNQAIGGNHSTITTANPLTGGGIGGGIVNFAGGTMTVSNCTIEDNQARGGATDAGPGGSAVGGGIENTFSLIASPAVSTLTVIDSAIIDNVAVAGRGGPGASAVPAGLAAGGGIDNSFHSIASLTDCTIEDNQAIGAAGGAGANGGAGWGGAASVGINVLLGFTDASSLTLKGCTLSDNQVMGGQGGAGGNGGSGRGGGIAIVAGSSAIVGNCSITDNEARGGQGGVGQGGGAGGNGGDGLGGGLYNDATATLTVTASRVTHNEAEGGEEGTGGSDGMGVGGGVYNLGTFTRDVFTVIKKNHASSSNNDVFP
jgi:hypothetical protein